MTSASGAIVGPSGGAVHAHGSETRISAIAHFAGRCEQKKRALPLSPTPPVTGRPLPIDREELPLGAVSAAACDDHNRIRARPAHVSGGAACEEEHERDRPSDSALVPGSASGLAAACCHRPADQQLR